MEDILDRLKDRFSGTWVRIGDDICADLRGAIEEIERLRAELQRHQNAIWSATDDTAAQ